MPSDVHVVGAPRASAERRTVYASLAARAESDPARTYLRDGEESTTYGDLMAEVNDAAGRLAALGVEAGDRVVLWLPNGRRWVTLFFACARLGAIAVPAGTRLRTIDLRHILHHSQARLLLFAPHALGVDFERQVVKLLSDRVRGVLPDLVHAVSVGPRAPVGTVALDAVEPIQDTAVFPDANAPAVLCYTSGTTGRPKGCLHAHRTLVHNGTVGAGLGGLGPEDRILSPVPFAHVFGFHMTVLQAALVGATVINGEPFRAGPMLDLVERERATVVYGVPTMAREMLVEQARRPRDLSSVRLALMAGAPVSAELRRRVSDPYDGFGAAVSIVYGCTEAPTISQLLPDDPPSKAADSVGRPTPGVEVRICRPGGHADAPDGEVGEILCRGYNTMIGYHRDPDATAAKHRDGWLATGDMGWADTDGFLYFVGRSSEMFLVGGFNAYPREIEAQLEQLDGVVEAAVVGVPDARLGSVPMAWLIPASPALAEEAVIDWARRNMASYKRPRHVRIVESLPRTANGKLSRVGLERLARRALPQLDWEGAEG